MDRRPGVVPILLFLAGCGTTRTTDTSRTATEQLLLSDAVDRSLGDIRFDALSGRKVCLEEKYAGAAVDVGYMLSSVREKLLLDGALLCDKKEEADVVVEVRVGALGTDRYEWLIGIPQVSGLSAAYPQVALPPALPEVPLVKKVNQQGVAKIHIYAYERRGGRLVAMSGRKFSTTDSQSTWLGGLGPIQRGSVHREVRVAGTSLPLPSVPQVASRQAKEASSPAESPQAQPPGPLAPEPPSERR